MATDKINTDGDYFGNYELDDYIKAHKHSSRHREEIKQSSICGCFYCLRIFKPIEITDWWDTPKGTPEFLDNELGATAVVIPPF